MAGRHNILGEVARHKLENMEQVLKLSPGLKEHLKWHVTFWQLSSYPYWKGRVGIQRFE